MTLLSFVENLELGVFLVLAGVAVEQWRRQRSRAAAWLATTVLVLTVLVAYGRVVQPDETGRSADVARRAIVVLLAFFPYSLSRFAACFTGPRRLWDRVALGGTGMMMASALALPALTPPADGAWPWWMTAYAAGMAVEWTALSVLTIQALSRGARGEPAVARRRMGLLALAVVVLNVSLLILVGSGAKASGAAVLWQQAGGLLSGVLFLTGFAPPAPLRMWWRRREMEAFRSGEAGLMRADSEDRVALIILPHALALVGARGAVLIDERGRVRGRLGIGEAAAAGIAGRLPSSAGPAGEAVILPGLVAVPVRFGWLAMVTSPATPLFGTEEIGLLGTLAHLAGLALDRVELFERERVSRRALAEREFQLAEAQRTARIGSYAWDPDAGEVTWSDEMYRLLGFEPGEVTDHGRAFASRVHREDRDRVVAMWADAARTAAASDIEYRIVLPGGDVRWIQGRVQPATDDGSFHRRLVGTIQDVTDRKLTEDRLREAVAREQRMVAELRELARVKTDFISTISHELRTPLTSIAGYVELLADGAVGPLTSRQLDVLEVVDRNARRLTALIEDLLTLSSIDSGGFTLTRAPLDVTALLEGVHRAVLPAAIQRGLTLTLDVDRRAGTLVADAAQLDRVLLNLLSNAIKFTPEGGRVTVWVRREGEEMVFGVADTGIGIPLEEQEQLFSRFFRSSTATDRAIQGTGLGLAIVKTIVEEHGGRITLESAPGVGTTVTFVLPAVVPPASPTDQVEGSFIS